MTLTMPSASRSALRFRLLGFPIGVDLSFLLVLAFLGFNTLQRGLPYLAVWIAVAAVSVLVHELGHAVTARAAGARPTIELYGFGGVTSFRLPPGGLSRLRSIGISVAGPATGLVVGALLIYLRRIAEIDPDSLAGYAVYAGIFVTLVWGGLNLLPILPLDGGNVLVELMPGGVERRRWLAAWVSIVFAVVAGVFALMAGQIFAALLAGWFAFGNVMTVRQRPGAATAAPPALTAEQVAQVDRDSKAVLWLLDQAQLGSARHLAETAPSGIDAGVAGILIAALGDVDGGLEVVDEAASVDPANPLRQECLRRAVALRPVDGAT